jgi:hypothetical protein
MLIWLLVKFSRLLGPADRLGRWLFLLAAGSYMLLAFLAYQLARLGKATRRLLS